MFLSAPFSRRTRRELAYVLASLPLAVFGFLIVFALFAPIFPPALAAMVWLAGWTGQVHRGLAQRLLGVAVPPPVPAPLPSEPGLIAWTVAQFRDRAGWRAVAFTALQLPYAVLMVAVGVGAWLYAVVGIGSPLLIWLPFALPGAGLMTSWPAVLIGLVLLFAAPWVVHALVRWDIALMTRLLGRQLRDRVRDLERTRALAVDDAAATLRRVERDLHDGAQARLVALAMDLTMMRDRLSQESPDLTAARDLADAAHSHAKAAIGELRDLARGIHPPVLDRGLAEALQTLAAHNPVSVVVNADLPRRPAPAIETIAYFCAGELLTNVARHSGARTATVDVGERDGAVELRVSDDGVGGASSDRGGTGLSGLADRVRTVDGTLSVDSPDGGPTVVTVRLPWHA
jgi:signal transduction histidine kinase